MGVDGSVGQLVVVAGRRARKDLKNQMLAMRLKDSERESDAEFRPVPDLLGCVFEGAIWRGA
jgi:hypothetical protein